MDSEHNVLDTTTKIVRGSSNNEMKCIFALEGKSPSESRAIMEGSIQVAQGLG
jgi:hypothetical protein